MNESSNSISEKYKTLAHTITYATTPGIVGALALFYILYYFSPTPEIFYKTFFWILVLSIILPVLFILYLIKNDKVSNFHLKERKDRIIPLGFMLFSGIISLNIVRTIETDPTILRMFLIFFVMALGYTIITLFRYKPSGHMFVFTSVTLMLMFFINTNFISLTLLLIPIGWSRVYTREHSINEVLIGSLYAIASFLALSILIST